MRFLCRAPAPEFAARSTLLRGLLRIVRTRLFKFTPSLLLTDEFEHVLFRLHSPGVLDLFGLTCVDEALLNDVPWIAMIFVRHLAAARVAHRETPSGFALVRCREAGLAGAGHACSDETRTIRNTEDRHELGDVCRDRALRDAQRTRDLARAVPAAKKIHDLDLPRREAMTPTRPPWSARSHDSRCSKNACRKDAQ